MRWIAAVAICLAVGKAAPARAQGGDWGVTRNPFDATVVKRYKAILATDPHDPGALRALMAMYKRYRSLAKLEEDYRAEPESWATLVVLARLPRTNRSETLALWNRALKAKPDDGRGWIAFGELSTEATVSRDAFQRAVTLAKTPKDKKGALHKLVGAARSAGDHATVDAAYVELIALSPKDGLLWLERGSAQLAAGRAQAALESFVAAEQLFKTDHERRFTAMMNQGSALQRMGKVDDAIAQYIRVLDKLPRGYFLAGEIIMRIIDTERKRKNLPAAILLLEQRWPEKSRQHFEWATLGDLYKESQDDQRALEAYKHAVKKAPTEVATQRKLIVLLDKYRPSEALPQHEAAARLAPGDADLQLELAKRYYPAETPKALATLERLSKRHARNVTVRRTIASLYDQWDQPAKAIGEYEAIVALEPGDIDHVITLGDAYWRGNELDKARAAWAKLAKINTPKALLQHGEVLALHELFDEAVDAYTKSLALDGTNPEVWRGRASAHDSLGRYQEATADAQRAVALIGLASRDDGNRERHLLSRVLGHWQDQGSDTLGDAVRRWRFAFERGDVAAGYMLVAHHSRLASTQHHDVLVALYKRVPTDDSLGMALARSYGQRKEFGKAKRELDVIQKRSPKRTEEITKLLARLEEDRIRAEQDARWADEGLSERERQQRRQSGRRPDIVGSDRGGARLVLGSDVRDASGALVGFGIYRAYGIAEATSMPLRFDYFQRDDEMEELNVVGLSIGLSRRVVDAHRFEIAAGADVGVELRFGSSANATSWDRAAIAGDLIVEVLPRAIPATLGVRWRQELTESPRSAALMFELGFEVR